MCNLLLHFLELWKKYCFPSGMVFNRAGQRGWIAAGSPFSPVPLPSVTSREKLVFQPYLVAVRSSSTDTARPGAQGQPQSVSELSAG